MRNWSRNLLFLSIFFLSLSLSKPLPFTLSLYISFTSLSLLSLPPSQYLSFYLSLSFSLRPSLSLSLLSIILFGVSNGRFRPCSYERQSSWQLMVDPWYQYKTFLSYKLFQASFTLFPNRSKIICYKNVLLLTYLCTGLVNNRFPGAMWALTTTSSTSPLSSSWLFIIDSSE